MYDRIGLSWYVNPLLNTYDSDLDLRKQLLQVASGVSYLHDLKPVVIHGDLKGVTQPAVVSHVFRAINTFACPDERPHR